MISQHSDLAASVRPMSSGDVDRVVEIHLASFEGFFLSFLGSSFLRLFYAGIVSSPLGIGLVVTRLETPVGFVCGAISPSEFYRELIRKKWASFAFSSLHAVIRRPTVVPRLFRALKKPAGSEKGMNRSMLMSIGVDPAVQNKGYGKVLIFAFLDRMREKGVESVAVTTDRNGNDSVNAFYARNGWKLSQDFVTAEGRCMNEYTYNLRPVTEQGEGG